MRRQRLRVAAIAAVLSIPVLVTQPALLDAESGAPAGDLALRLPPLYVAFAPLTSLLDTLSLLTVRQHVSLGVTVLVCAMLAARPWRAGRQLALPGEYADRPKARGMSKVRRALLVGGATCTPAVAALLGLAALYAAATLLPRPMARLVVAANADDVVTVDFHSHTAASHDGRRGFDADANRAWHRAAGFDAAYVTDHGRTDSALAAAARNPARAGYDTVLLPGIEVVYQGEHVVGLGPDAGRAFGVASPASAPRARPVIVHTIPERLANVVPRDARGAGGAAAIELADACPRGIEQASRDRGRILRLADSLDLAVVSASNDHGWSRTAAAWSLLHVPGWRRLSPAALDSAIRRTIERRRRHAVRVVLRRPVPGASSPLGLALTGPAVLWTALATQSLPARLATTMWIGLALLAPFAARVVSLRRPLIRNGTRSGSTW